MKAVNGATRAKRAYLQVEKQDKYGRKYVGQNEVVVSHGMFSAREAERELQRAADSASADGQKVVGWKVDPYTNKEVPDMYGNPRRADGTGTVWGGFYGASWPPPSPTERAINSRREQAKS